MPKKENVVVSEEVPQTITRDGKVYTVAQMMFTGRDIESYKRALGSAKIKYRTIKYRQPNDNIVATIFYTLKTGNTTKKVRIKNYGEWKEYPNLTVAKKRYLELMRGSEGSERDRYTRIFFQLQDGNLIASDEWD